MQVSSQEGTVGASFEKRILLTRSNRGVIVGTLNMHAGMRLRQRTDCFSVTFSSIRLPLPSLLTFGNIH